MWLVLNSAKPSAQSPPWRPQGGGAVSHVGGCLAARRFPGRPPAAPRRGAESGRRCAQPPHAPAEGTPRRWRPSRGSCAALGPGCGERRAARFSAGAVARPSGGPRERHGGLRRRTHTSPAKMRGGQRRSSTSAASRAALSLYSGIWYTFLARQESGVHPAAEAETARGRLGAPRRCGWRAAHAALRPGRPSSSGRAAIRRESGRGAPHHVFDRKSTRGGFATSSRGAIEQLTSYFPHCNAGAGGRGGRGSRGAAQQ